MQTIWLPIIVVSGHANEVEQAVDLMKLEADDVIEKPYFKATVVRKVWEALVKSGRETHIACARAPCVPNRRGSPRDSGPVRQTTYGREARGS